MRLKANCGICGLTVRQSILWQFVGLVIGIQDGEIGARAKPWSGYEDIGTRDDLWWRLQCAEPQQRVQSIQPSQQWWLSECYPAELLGQHIGSTGAPSLDHAGRRGTITGYAKPGVITDIKWRDLSWSHNAGGGYEVLYHAGTWDGGHVICIWSDGEGWPVCTFPVIVSAAVYDECLPAHSRSVSDVDLTDHWQAACHAG